MKTTLMNTKLMILLVGVLFSMSLTAQKVVPDSLSLFDDITAYSLNWGPDFHQDGPAITEGTGGWALEYTVANDWIEFQIIAPVAGQYALTVPVSSDRSTSSINVSVYPADSAFVMNGTTTYTYNGQWQTPVDYIFPFDIEAGVVYNLRVTFVGQGANIFNDGFAVAELEGPADATLKDIAIDGVTIPGFSSDVLEYTIALEPDVWIDELTVEATDATADLVVSEIAFPEEGVSATAKIVCTSLSGITLSYTVNVVMPTEVYDGGILELNAYDIFYSNGVMARGTKLNNFNNNDYIEYYIYSAYDDNMAVTLETTNGYTPDADSYLNVSILSMEDSTWVLQDRNTQFVPMTYSLTDPAAGEWNKDLCTPNNLSYIIQLKEYVPVRLRIYANTNKGNCADVSAISFKAVTESIENTLSDLTVNGTTITDFDPEVTDYTVALPAGATSVEIGATPADDAAQGVEGTGTFEIINGTAEIVCTSEAGYPLTYRVSFETPKMILAGDTLVMGDDVYTKSHSSIRTNNVRINYFADSMYVEYYIYSETSEDMHVTILTANGNQETTYSKVNIGTYAPGTEWSSEMGITKDIDPTLDVWAIEDAVEKEYNISLVANEAVILRIFAFTSAPVTMGDIYRITFNDGHTTVGGEDDGVPAGIREVAMPNNISVITTEGSLSVIGDEAMLGASVKIYDISGRLVVNQVAKSTNESYSINQSGMYIVRVVSPENAVSTVKCIVR